MTPSPSSTTAKPRRRAPVRKRSHRGTARRSRLGWRARFSIASVVAVAGLLGWATLARQSAPRSNTALDRFDAIIVLGTPADNDGDPTPTQLARVTEAVREYERGVAPRIIMTGGRTHRQFVEADVMARTAEAQGIPASAIVEEKQARNTIENACYSARIMKDHGWQSAEIVSSASHLPRAALIFSDLPLQWRVHAAPDLEPASAFWITQQAVHETLSTARFLVWSREMDRCPL